MASVASYVYTRLGVGALENWTNLTQEMKQLQDKLEKAKGDEVDTILQMVHSVGMQIAQIEREAKVPPDLTS